MDGKHAWIDRKALLDRARRVQGQATALHKMIEDDRHCAEILQQVAALNSAARRLAVLLLEDHIRARAEADMNPEALAEESADLARRVLKI